MPKGYVYILECSDGSYYTGSTIDIEKSVAEHNDGKGANHTKKRLPVKLKYIEEFQRIDDAFYREKQIQGWSKAKKEALIKNQLRELKNLAECKNESHYKLWLRLRSATENQSIETYQSNGKLLLTGEYVVLDGAKALALPTKFGQSLKVEENNTNTIFWKSFDENGNIWFENTLIIDDGEIIEQIQGGNDISKRLKQILKATQELNPNFLSTNQGYTISTHLNFNRNWGLGTSSTLINNISQWANVDAYQLLDKTFGGSGYDIACAKHNTPITFQLDNSKRPMVNAVDFNPSFKDNLYFVYLNKKQNSRDGIKAYKLLNKISDSILNSINDITEEIITAKSLSIFEQLIDKHENIISELLNQEPVKSKFFTDYDGSIKSLGAWGGDFILVTSENNPSAYFKSKGLETVIPYSEMVMN
ncbi:GYDIA family GHMP kinase [Winogradskyella sp. HB-48]|uniref:GYDIA family GHMP kinase n=1 Tax=Winogradskyella sp. HB-48 TaxID=3416808 RepID=UPI003CF1E2D3